MTRHRSSSSRVAVLLALCLVALPAAAEQTSQLIVKFKPTTQKSSATLRLARLAEDAGVRLAHVRTLATGAELAALDASMSVEDAAALARRIAADPGVDYAEPDRRAHPARSNTTDPYFVSQGYLSNAATSIGAYSAWDVTTGSPAIVVAVLDTGVRPHVDLAGRMLPGYDMVSGVQSANDGDGRDPDPTDPGDWVASGETVDGNTDCTARNSSWHGTSVSGVIAADSDNNSYIAGIDWSAKILPVRVLGKCGGRISDIADGIAWAAGLRVPGVPANPTPAQVINMSLGGDGACSRTYQSAIDAALANGVRAIVAAAGNDSEDASLHDPANCTGVISVASTTSLGDLSSYSNFGAGVTISAPGGNYTAHSGAQAIVALSNTGTTAPGADGIAALGGTSFAAPMVSGTVALMLSVAPNLTSTQVHDILVATAKPFVPGSSCTTSTCGPGLVDANAAVHAAAATAPPAPVSVVEYYNATLDHFFITWSAAEQANLDAGNTPTRWVRTGYAFKAYTTPVAGASPVCRYYIPPMFGDSHFFGRGTAECNATGAQHPTFVLEDPAFMQMFLPVAGVCPAGTTPIYRVFSNRADANHRYMTDRAVRDMMVSRGWTAEGDGPDLVVMCAPG